MLLAIVAVFLSQHLPCDQQGQPRRETAEPPLCSPAPQPLRNIGNGFIPYHLIPPPRFPLAEAVIDRARSIAENRPRIWRR